MLSFLYYHAAFSAVEFRSNGIHGTLNLTSAQTIGSFNVSGFNYAPPAQFNHRRVGDITLRARQVGAATYSTLMTPSAQGGSKTNPSITPVVPPPAGELAAAHLVLQGSDAALAAQLGLTRHWSTVPDAEGGGIRFWYDLHNNGSSAVEIGAWGATMTWMGMSVQHSGRTTLDSLAATCSFVDPAIAGEHGWVSVTRMTGLGAVVLLAVENGTSFEAYRFANEAQGGTFFELTSHSAAYVAEEWQNASKNQWLPPTSRVLPPGATTRYTYRLVLASSLREKDAALAASGLAVLEAVPAWTIATDMADATLHVLPPRGEHVATATVTPAGALTLGAPVSIGSKGYWSIATRGVKHGRARLTLTYSDGSTHVASYFVLPPLHEHVTSYSKFLAKTAWYPNVTDPFSRGHSVLAWNRERKMHIGVGAWDNGYEDNRIFNNGLSDEAGAGQHVGLGAVVGGLVDPDAVKALDLYINDTLYGVKSGLPFGASLQCVEGAEALESPSCGPPSVVGPTADGVMASMFWVPSNITAEPPMPGYDYNPKWFCDDKNPKRVNCTTGWPGWRWDQARGASLGRAYNYAHVSSSYLGAYQAARYDAIKMLRPRTWYLTRAYKTITAMYYQASWYAHQGLMDGTNFRTVLYALKDEGMDAEAKVVEDIMRNRTQVGVTNQCRFYVTNNTIYDLSPPPHITKPGCHWYADDANPSNPGIPSNLTTPWVEQTGLPGAGSEFSWDTTGQEEAYIWGKYFGEEKLALSSLNQILAYTPLVPNWAWHGSAFGFGDFSNNGVIRGANGGGERVLQHYRSGLNSIPTTEAFLSDPSDLYLLRLASGSIGGVLANIEVGSGAPAMAFHSDASMLKFDAASGDYGLAFYGHSHNTMSFLVQHEDFGWLCYWCDLEKTTTAAMTTKQLSLYPRDTYRRTVHIAPLGLQIVADVGVISSVELTLSAADNGSAEIQAVKVIFAAVGQQALTKYRLRLNTRSGDHKFVASGVGAVVRGAYDVPIATPSVEVKW